MENKKPWEENWDASASEKKPWEESWEAPQPVEEVASEPKTSQLEAGITGFGQGTTFGFGEEMAAGVGAGLEKLNLQYLIDRAQGVPSDLAGEPTDRSFKESYTQQRDQLRAQQKQMSEEHPWTYGGAELGGAIASSFIGGAPATAKGILARAGAEGAAYGLGTSEADLTEEEYGEALKDTGIGLGLGVGTAGLFMGGGKLAKAGYRKYFGKGGKDLASDAAGDILELTPKQRRESMSDVVKMGPGKRSTVAEELPSYLKEQGGLLQTTKKIKENTEKALREAGDEIDDVLNTYEKRMEELTDVKLKKIAEDESTVTMAYDDLLKNMKAELHVMETTFNFQKLADDIAEKVRPLREVPGYESQLKKLDKHLEKLRAKEDVVSIRELHNLRKNTDKLIKSFQGVGKSTSADALLQDALVQTRRQMSNHIQDEMLGGAKKLADDLLDIGRLTQKEYEELVTLQDRIYKANRNYKLARFVDDQIDQAIGRKDARKLVGLTDWIIGGASSAAGGPATGLMTVAAKKTAEFARPRAQLYSKEIGKVVQEGAKYTRAPFIQQVNKAVQGTKYQQVFDPNDPKGNAVKHKLLMDRDAEYRKRFTEKDKEE